MKIRKAEDHEKKNYRGGRPLFGFVTVDAVFAKAKTRFVCPVEYLGEGKDEPNYEVIAPSGLHFETNRTHTILGTTQRDLLDQIDSLVECDENC